MKQILLIALLLMSFSTACAEDNTDMTLFTEEEIAFSNDSVSLSGTLSIPNGEGPFPVVLMVTGSGPQNRDEEIYGFMIFKDLSDYLLEKGIATFRYDDRGVGKSGGDRSISTIFDFADDAGAALEMLKTKAHVNKEKIYVLGHSEGGIVASILAAEDESLAGIILMAGPATSGDSINNEQIRFLNSAEGKSDEEIQEIIAFQNDLYDELRKDSASRHMDLIENKLIDIMEKSILALPEEQRQGITDIREFSKYQARMQMAQVQTPWFHSFITYDPAENLGKAKCGILAIFGAKDSQVPASMNIRFLEKAMKEAGKTNYSVIVIKDANHLFQVAETGSPNEYPQLEKKFADGFLNAVSDYILKDK